MSAERAVTLVGPPVTVELQQLFGLYAGNATVKGIVVLQEGINVQFEDGQDFLFIAVPNGSVLMARPDGKLEVLAADGEERPSEPLSEDDLMDAAWSLVHGDPEGRS